MRFSTIHLDRIPLRTRHVICACAISLLANVLLILGWNWFLSQAPASAETQRTADALGVFEIQLLETPLETVQLAPQVEITIAPQGDAEESDLAPPRVGSLPAHLKPSPPKVVKPITPPQPAPPAQFFGAKMQATRIVFVIDRSISMATSGTLPRARNEICQCISRMAPTARFQVLFYNQHVSPLPLGGKHDLIPILPETVKHAKDLIQKVRGGGSTDHVQALQWALAYRPEVIYLATDAENLTTKEVEQWTRLNQRATKAIVNVMDLSTRFDANEALQKLARTNGGSYVHPRLHPDQP